MRTARLYPVYHAASPNRTEKHTRLKAVSQPVHKMETDGKGKRQARRERANTLGTAARNYPEEKRGTSRKATNMLKIMFNSSNFWRYLILTNGIG